MKIYSIAIRGNGSLLMMHINAHTQLAERLPGEDQPQDDECFSFHAASMKPFSMHYSEALQCSYHAGLNHNNGQPGAVTANLAANR